MRDSGVLQLVRKPASARPAARMRGRNGLRTVKAGVGWLDFMRALWSAAAQKPTGGISVEPRLFSPEPPAGISLNRSAVANPLLGIPPLTLARCRASFGPS